MIFWQKTKFRGTTILFRVAHHFFREIASKSRTIFKKYYSSGHRSGHRHRDSRHIHSKAGPTIVITPTMLGSCDNPLQSTIEYWNKKRKLKDAVRGGQKVLPAVVGGWRTAGGGSGWRGEPPYWKRRAKRSERESGAVGSDRQSRPRRAAAAAAAHGLHDSSLAHGPFKIFPEMAGRQNYVASSDRTATQNNQNLEPYQAIIQCFYTELKIELDARNGGDVTGQGSQ